MSFDGFVSNGKPGYNRYSSAPYTTIPRVDQLDLTDSIGQRSATWQWQLINGVTGENLGLIYPLKDEIARISFDAGQTVKRSLRIKIDATDLAEINGLTDRILPSMLIGGEAWPMGRFMFTGVTAQVRTGGDDGSIALLDEMNLVDQEIETGFAPVGSCDAALRQLVAGLNLPQGTDFAASPYPSAGAWRIGSARGSIAATLAALGDFETPWMDNTGVMRTVRTVDPATSVPDLSFDDGCPVFRDTIGQTNDLLTAPNRFVVIGNGKRATTTEIVGRYDVPPSAPHSITNRGFAIQRTVDMQVESVEQANAAARSLGMRAVAVEQADLSTPPDPRHDGYQVIRWQGENWLETAWSVDCIEGGDMSHTLRRAYVA